MIRLFKRMISKTKDLQPKNPKDYTLTDSSTPWRHETYCPACKSVTQHHELMTDCCESCGRIGWLLGNHRSRRKIFTGTEWIDQYRY